MNRMNVFVIFSLLASFFSAHAGLYWVGNSPACNGSNVFGTLNQALLVAALNGDAQDEVRLTNTVNYTGNSNGSYELQDWSSSGAGELTLVGGYPDCFGAVNGRTFIGDTSSEIFEVNTLNESSSVVTFRNIQMSLTSTSRAMVIDDGAVVTLDNVLISSNQSGIVVSGGSYLDVLSNSLIQFNGNTTNTLGGGIYCTGANSTVILRGRLHRNRGLKGGNLHIRSGCYLELKDGVRIEGRGTLSGLDAEEGGGLYVDNGGQVFADGRANRVIFDANKADIGGAIYLNGTGFAVLQNTHINGSEATSGSAIYAQGTSSSVLQLTMEKTADCGLLFGCSEIQGSRHAGSVIEIRDSSFTIQRTVIEQSDYIGDPFVFAIGLIELDNSIGRLNRVGMIRNEGWGLFGAQTSSWEITHLTMANNNRPNSVNDSYVYIAFSNNLFNIQNSLITNSAGNDNRGLPIYSGSCNLIDNDSNWPAGIYHVGTPQLINPAAGDARQIASSDGVDMCEQDFFSWSNDVDIELQAAPVNENTNPQGMPGDAGGLFDVGFDEVYDNIGEDEFLLTIEKEGAGSGAVVSNPGGISCGVDCSEVYFNGTIVTLFATPAGGSEFMGWLNCPLVNQNDECLTNVQSSHTIRAVFEPDDLIFRDGFN